MAKERENYRTGFTTLMCTMIWETQTKELSLLVQHLVANKSRIPDGVVPVVSQLIPVSNIYSVR